MKTSFYFVVWILIYPILELINSNTIHNNSFIVAFAVVLGLSWLIKRLIPATLTYNRVSQIAPLLENVYTGNVKSLYKRLLQDMTIEIVCAVYFSITTVFIIFSFVKSGINDWIALLVFGYFTFTSVYRCVNMLKAKTALKSHPTSELCIHIAENIYGLNYDAYRESHVGRTYEEMLGFRPKYYKVFQVFSTIIAVVAILLGLLYIVDGMIVVVFDRSLEMGAFAGMYLLYGSLATYFGIKDIITEWVSKRRD